MSIHKEIQNMFEELQNKELTDKEAMSNGLRIIRSGETYSKMGNNLDGLPGTKPSEKAVWVLTTLQWQQKDIAEALGITRQWVAQIQKKLSELAG